jgi:hypothetical protein
MQLKKCYVNEDNWVLIMYFLSHIGPLSQEFTVYFKSHFAARSFNLILKGFEDGITKFLYLYPSFVILKGHNVSGTDLFPSSGEIVGRH